MRLRYGRSNFGRLECKFVLKCPRSARPCPFSITLGHPTKMAGALSSGVPSQQLLCSEALTSKYRSCLGPSEFSARLSQTLSLSSVKVWGIKTEIIVLSQR